MKFNAIIKIINGNPYVTPPSEVLQKIFLDSGKTTGPITVRGTLNNASFQQGLVRYMGDWRLYINGVMARNGGLQFTDSIASIVGKEVTLTLEYDDHPLTYPMIPEFKKALSKDSIAKNAYEALTTGRQKEILRYFSFLKTKESLDKNIVRVIQHLRGEESDALYPLMHRKKKN